MTGENPIFMDNHSTTPVDPRVLEAMLPYFTQKFGNAASRNHIFGWEAEKAVEKAREEIAMLIHADSKEIVFTSGATESNNLALKGVVEMYREKGDHIVISNTEHRSVLDTARKLEKSGIKTTIVPVDSQGIVQPEEVRKAITDKTILVSVMMVNNEIGTINPVAEIGAVTREKGVIFHCDATQGIGKIPVDVEAMKIDLMSFTAHKIYGPKGVGALYVRRKNPRVRLASQMDGGGHERGMRSGTLNVPGIAGFGEAIRICGEVMPEEALRIGKMRDRLRDAIMGALDHVAINGHPVQRIPNNLNISFAYVEGESLLMGLDKIALSSGSACTTATLEPSYVLRALGVGHDLAHSSIRFGIGRFNTMEEIEIVAKRTIDAVRRLREMSPLYEMALEGVDLSKVQWTQH
ncbi:MAG TPA: IscS subfamily cysteine desulfurase [Nitrospiria bacterium]|nr:IscS subfamily cysteine desulfurase [Nitrospiria bacterium]